MPPEVLDLVRPLGEKSLVQDTEPTTPTEKTIALFDYTQGAVHIFKAVCEDVDDYLYAAGFDMDNCYYMVDPEQINITL